MEELTVARKRLKTAHDNIERDYYELTSSLNQRESRLDERLHELNRKKHDIAEAYGKLDAADNDFVEVNAGGEIVVAKRSTLTQIIGTRLEALFSGRWEKVLQRDSHGRIFLDVNPTCFRAIVDYLNEVIISSEDSPPDPPCVEDEYAHILQRQLDLFGLDKVPTIYDKIPDSNIIKDYARGKILNDWLKEDGSDGDLTLIYRGSIDGLSGLAFHSKCDNKGCTLTVIETTCGRVIGGYSNTSWTSSGDSAANKAFLIANSNGKLAKRTSKALKSSQDKSQTVEPVTKFSDDINKAINAYQEFLVQAESEMLHLEDSFKEEQTFIEKFASGDAKDVNALNVNGALMVTTRSTLCTAVDSVLAQQFDDSKWTEQGCKAPRVMEWTPDQVGDWAKNVEGIQEDVSSILRENRVTGRELLSLNLDGLKMMGIERAGTLCLILDKINMLKQASKEIVTLIEHSPYCFGKILDHLCLKRLHSLGLLSEELTLPEVRDSKKKTFEKVVKVLLSW
ncbi:hypothetical protein ACHAW5_009657 [Stephanodiscus triporus]|uniref:SAM domain-containing protein n=1 Tax=Stephanodiscus triporus TaxID=2934178 RepID=A0ABD3N201_9STRA